MKKMRFHISPLHIAAAQAQLRREGLTSNQTRQRLSRVTDQCNRHRCAALEAVRAGQLKTAQYLLACFAEARAMMLVCQDLLASGGDV